MLILAEVQYTASFCLYTIKYKCSVCSQKPAFFCYRHLDSTSVLVNAINITVIKSVESLFDTN